MDGVSPNPFSGLRFVESVDLGSARVNPAPRPRAASAAAPGSQGPAPRAERRPAESYAPGEARFEASHSHDDRTGAHEAHLTALRELTRGTLDVNHRPQPASPGQAASRAQLGARYGNDQNSIAATGALEQTGRSARGVAGVQVRQAVSDVQAEVGAQVSTTSRRRVEPRLTGRLDTNVSEGFSLRAELASNARHNHSIRGGASTRVAPDTSLNVSLNHAIEGRRGRSSVEAGLERDLGNGARATGSFTVGEGRHGVPSAGLRVGLSFPLP